MEKNRLRHIALATLLAAAAGWAGAADPKASQYYEDALQRFEKKDYPGAIIQLKNALKIDNKQLSMQLLLGKALYANGEVRAAEVAFNESIRLGVNRAEVIVPMARAVIAQGKPRELTENARFALDGLPPATQAQLLILRAGAAADLGDIKGAYKAIDDARALDPKSADSYVAEVPIRVRTGQFKEALAAADKAVANAPEMADAHYLRGTVLHVQGNLAGAKAGYDKALSLQPTHTEALVSRAGLLVDTGKLPEAMIDVEELLRSSKREPRGQFLRAVIAEKKKDTATARAALQEVSALLDPVPLEFFRYRPQMLMLGGQAHYGLGNKEKAKPFLEGLQRLQPGSPGSKLLALIYLSENNLDRGIESLDVYLRAHPGDAQALHLLASAHMSQGRYARAAQLMQEALRSGDKPQLRALLGLSLVSAGKVGDAVTELEATLRKDPSQAQAAAALATIHMQAGRHKDAMRVADGLLKQQPGNPGVLNLVGTVRSAAGDFAGARTAFEQAAAADPKFAAPQVNLARLDRATGAYEKAVTRLDALLRANDKDVEVLTELGTILELLGRNADAQRWLEKAADHSSPTNLEPALMLVQFHLRTGRPDQAREAVKRLTAKAPEDVRVLVTVARVSLANGDAAGARPNLTRAASASATDAAQLVQIAMLQVEADHLPGAAYTVEKALAERPDFLPAQALMTEIELRQGEAAKAEKRARQIIAKWPKAGVGHALLGDIARARKDAPAALDSYRKAHQIEQTSESFIRVYGALGATDSKGAAAFAEQWVKTHPKDPVARRALADGYARAANYAAARGAYEDLIKLQPEDAEALNNLAHVLILSGDTAGGLKTAQAALQKQPNRPHIISTAGWAAFKAGQADKGLQLLRDARLRDPNNADTRYYLGAVLAGAGRKAEAREELQAALRSGGNFFNAKSADELLKTLN